MDSSKPISIKDKQATIFSLNFNLEDFTDVDLERICTLIKKEKVNFVYVDFPRDFEEFEDSALGNALDTLRTPYYKIKVPNFVLSYLYEEIEQENQLIDTMVKEYQQLKDQESEKAQNLKAWIEIFTGAIEEKERFLSVELRARYIVKEIVSQFNKIEGQEVTALLFSQDDVFSMMSTYLKNVNIKVIELVEKEDLKYLVNKF